MRTPLPQPTPWQRAPQAPQARSQTGGGCCTQSARRGSRRSGRRSSVGTRGRGPEAQCKGGVWAGGKVNVQERGHPAAAAAARSCTGGSVMRHLQGVHSTTSAPSACARCCPRGAATHLHADRLHTAVVRRGDAVGRRLDRHTHVWGPPKLEARAQQPLAQRLKLVLGCHLREMAVGWGGTSSVMPAAAV